MVPMSTTRLIKKDPNRRLYDTEISSYITLEEVRQLVLDGESFEVRDARSHQDITRLILMQIIAEREENSQPVLSEATLKQIILYYGDVLQQQLSQFLEHSLHGFSETAPQLRKQAGNGHKDESPFAQLNLVTERSLELWKTAQLGGLKGASLGSTQPKKKVARRRRS